jgi:pimeloyl-ACP methyl ester carboxylesterase
MTQRCLGRVAARAALGIAAAAGLYAVGSYVWHDQEKLDLTEEARRGVPGAFVRLRDGAVHYEIAGPADARTVVLVHGFSVPYFVWDPTFDALVAAGMRVVRYDLYGRGWSDRPDVAYDAELFDRQLVELLDALSLGGRVDLAGFSMGGSIVAGFAARHPERVRTVALFGPGYGTGSQPPWPLRTPVVGEYIMDTRIAPKLAELQLDDFEHRDGHEDYVARYREQQRYKGFRRAILSTMRAFEPRDVSADYRAMSAGGRPVLVVWGREDRDVPFALSEPLLRDVPQAEFHAIDAGHLAHYERADVVSPLFVSFLRAH